MNSVRTKARVLALAELGWTAAEIERRLKAEHEHVPPARTIRYWINPGREAQRQRKAYRREKMLDRAEQLRRAGLSYKAVATVLAIDFGCTWSQYSIRDNLIERGVPKDLRRATPQQLSGLRRGVAA